MGDSVYRVTEVIGTSGESWEAAAANAVATAAASVRDLRVAEVLRQDVTIENGAITSYRVRLGKSSGYDKALADFAIAYADQTARPCRAAAGDCGRQDAAQTGTRRSRTGRRNAGSVQVRRVTGADRWRRLATATGI